jgi:hypothetical protein
MIRKFALLCASLLFLAGCASTPRLAPTEAIHADEGVIVTTLHTNWPHFNNPLFGSLTLSFISEENDKSAVKTFSPDKSPDFRVMKLKAGRYKWRRVTFATDRYAQLSEQTGFEVQPGKITYIGDIHITVPETWHRFGTVEIRVNNAAETSREVLSSQYPALSQRFGFETKLTDIRFKK